LIPDQMMDGTKPFKEFISGRAKLLAQTAERLIKTG